MNKKYARLILEQCLDLKNSTYLYICYQKGTEEFANIVREEALKRNVEVRLSIEDNEAIAQELMCTPLEDIKDNSLFSREEWNKVAIEGGAILFIETVTEDYFEKVDSQKFEELMRVRRNSKPVYDQKLNTKELSWCIVVYPSAYWAKRIFPNEKDSYQKLLELIYQICMIDKEDPIEEWKKELNRSKEKANYLNSLGIKQLHYQNERGTNFTVNLPEQYQFCSAGDRNAYGVETIVNMPSYEVFTSPDYRTTEGVIYSSKPLFYQGRKIDDFFLRFEKGKVVEIEASLGKDVLEGIVYGEENSSFLGEIALVDYHSPISNTGKVFETTLLDENASCHVALGCGFSEAILGGELLSEEERYERGINKAKTHVDFMIGTADLKIEALTKEGRMVTIFENGDFLLP